MFKVQYRDIDTDLEGQDYYGKWITWDKLGEFQTLYLAAQAVLKVAYKNRVEHFLESTCREELPIYEAAIKPREYQFRFPQTHQQLLIRNYTTNDKGVPVIKESPWHVGINDG